MEHIVNEQLIKFIESLHLSTIFAASTMAIVLIGILALNLFKSIDHKLKSLVINLVILLILIEVPLILSFFAHTAFSRLFFLLELLTAFVVLLFGLRIFSRFHKLLNKKIYLTGVFFALTSMLGVFGLWLFGNSIVHVIALIGTNGLFICLYFLIMVLLIKFRKT